MEQKNPRLFRDGDDLMLENYSRKTSTQPTLERKKATTTQLIIFGNDEIHIKLTIACVEILYIKLSTLLNDPSLFFAMIKQKISYYFFKFRTTRLCIHHSPRAIKPNF